MSMQEITHKMYVAFHVKCPLLLPEFNHTWNVPTYRISVNLYNTFPYLSHYNFREV
jgi:hypothetical protein